MDQEDENNNLRQWLLQVASSSLDHGPSSEAYAVMHRLQTLLLFHVQENPSNSLQGNDDDNHNRYDNRNDNERDRNRVEQRQTEAADWALDIGTYLSTVIDDRT